MAEILLRFLADNLNYSDFIRGIEKLTLEQMQVLYERLKHELSKAKGTVTVNNESIEVETKTTKIVKIIQKEYVQKPQSIINCCLHCGSIAIKKHGTTKGGVQRYICKDCGKSFSENHGLITHYSHLSEWQWQEVIRGTVNGMSITTIAKNIDASTSTVWSCRLKVYQTIKNIYGYCDAFNNIVEADGTYTRVSFKGYKQKDYFIDQLGRLPRHHRNKSERIEYLEKSGKYEELFKTKPELLQEMVCTSQKKMSGLDTIDKNHQQVCILTAVDRVGNLYIEPATAGTAESKDVYNKFIGRVTKDAVFVTDTHHSYKLYTCKEQINHVKILSKYHANGTFSLSRVNSIHSLLKEFLGVKHGYAPATKYLDLYLMMFWWLQKNKDLKSSDMYQKLYDIMTGHVENEIRAKMTRVTIACLVSRPLPIDTKGFY